MQPIPDPWNNADKLRFSKAPGRTTSTSFRQPPDQLRFNTSRPPLKIDRPIKVQLENSPEAIRAKNIAGLERAGNFLKTLLTPLSQVGLASSVIVPDVMYRGVASGNVEDNRGYIDKKLKANNALRRVSNSDIKEMQSMMDSMRMNPKYDTKKSKDNTPVTPLISDPGLAVVVDPDAIAADQLKQLGLVMQEEGVRDASLGQMSPDALLSGGGSGQLPDNPAAAIKSYLESEGGKKFMGGVTFDDVQDMQMPDSGTDVGTQVLPVASLEDARKAFLTGTTSLDGLRAMEEALGLRYAEGGYYLNAGGSPLKVSNERARAYKRGELGVDELRNNPLGEVTSPARAQQPNFSVSKQYEPVSEQTNPGIAFDPAFDNFNRANQTPFETNFAELSASLRDMGSNFTPYFSDASKFYGY